MAAQEEPQRGEEVPEEKEAAPAAADRGLPPMAAPEEEGGPGVDEDPPPMTALRKRRPAMGLWTAMAAMLAFAGVQYPDFASGFTAYEI